MDKDVLVCRLKDVINSAKYGIENSNDFWSRAKFKSIIQDIESVISELEEIKD